jgi:hypothetical protein
VRVHAPLDAVWATLTDYEGLADFIPGLSECRLLDQHDGFARLYQVRSAPQIRFLLLLYSSACKCIQLVHE